MAATLEHGHHAQPSEQELWAGGRSPFKTSYGKVMMWYFLISDTFTFASFLIAYSALRFTQSEAWPKAAEVFKSIPIHGLDHYNLPLVFVSFMTFLLIVSSYTMVRAVQEGYRMNKSGVIKFLIPTLVCGVLFLGCQYLEWTHLIHDGMTATTASEATKVCELRAVVLYHHRFPRLARIRRSGIVDLVNGSYLERHIRKTRTLRNGRENWFVLALC
jgi:cytochrome c oxidase subunit 3